MRGAKTKLLLERYADTPDGMGGYEREWERVMEIPGVFYGAGGGERQAWMKPTVEGSHYFIYRRIRGVTVEATDRFRLGDRLFNIVDVDHDKTHRANWDNAVLKEYET